MAKIYKKGSSFRSALCYIVLIVCALASSQGLHAQALHSRDAKQIIFLSNQLLGNYEQTVNYIASSNWMSNETKELIESTYTPGQRQLFTKKEVVVEDDINPARFDSTTVEDKPIDQYLNAMDVGFGKRPDDFGSVEFGSRKMSNIKKSDFIYVNISYTSAFMNPSKMDSTAYRPTQRVMTIRAEKDKEGKWRTLISGIRFGRRSDTLAPKRNDVAIIQDGGMGIASTQDLDILNKVMQEEARKEYETNRQDRDKAYARAIVDGDSALDENKFDVALELYNKAVDINPINFVAKAKAKEAERELKKKREQDTRETEDLLAMGDEAYKVRDYPVAKNCFELILRRQPDSEPLKEKLRDTETNLVNLQRLESQVKPLEVDKGIKVYNKEIDKALKERNDALLADLLVARARLYVIDKDYKAAKKDYNKALALVPAHRPALVGRAALNVLNGEPFMALTDYTQVIANSKFSSKYYVDRAKIQLVLKDTLKALEDFEQGIALSPTNTDLLYQRALVYQAGRRHGKAVADMSTAISLAPESGAYYYQRGQAYLAMGDVERAAKDFASARTRGVTDKQRNTMLEQAFKYYENASYKYDKANYAAALGPLQDANLLDPSLAEAWMLKGKVLLATREYRASIAAHEQALQVRDTYKDALLGCAEAYLKLGEIEQAVAKAEQAVKMDNRHAEAYLMLGKANYLQGSKVEAEAAFKRAITVAPENPTPYEDYAKFLSDIGDYEKAEKQASMAERKNGNMARVNSILAKNAIGKRDWREALKYADKSLKTGQSLPLAHLARAQANIKLLTPSKAEADLNVVIDKDPYYEYPEARLLLARSYIGTGSYRKAQSALESLKPDLQKAEYNTLMAQVHLLQNEVPKAKAALDKVAGTDAQAAEYLYTKATLLWLEGNESLAIDHFGRAFDTKLFEQDEVKKDPLVKSFATDKRFKACVKSHF